MGIRGEDISRHLNFGHKKASLVELLLDLRGKNACSGVSSDDARSYNITDLLLGMSCPAWLSGAADGS